MSYGDFARDLAAPADVTVVNGGSTATIEKYMVVACGVGVPWTTTLDVDASIGKCPPSVAATTLSNQTNAFGIAQVQMGPGKVGTIRRFGLTFVRVGGQTINAGQRGATTAAAVVTGGVVTTASDAAAVFYCQVTASVGITYENTLISFTVSHALGICSFMAHRF